MKSVILKSFFAILLLSTAYSVNSQTVAQGIWTAGGSVGFSSSKQKGAINSSTIIQLLPEAGYFVIDDLGVGLNLIYARTSQNNNSLTDLALGPWARYYVLKGSFVQAGFNMGTTTIKGDFGKAKTTSTDLNFGIGYSAWLTNSVALEPMVYDNINKQRDENSDPVNTNTFGLRIGLQVYFGR